MDSAESPNKIISGFDRVTSDIQHPNEFKNLFQRIKKIGQGGDGAVFSYRHISTKIDIAVKIPASRHGGRDLVKEIQIHTSLEGEHEHIVKLLAANNSHHVLGPVMFLELCQFGDLFQYREKWCDQERMEGRLERPSESTIWKLLKDMSLALDFLHNSFSVGSYVHNDLKPHNIFVTYPSGWTHSDDIPTEPVFKLGDFSRLACYPTMNKASGWMGTPEYAPPLREQRAPIKPSVDIWCLGATIQGFALNVPPIQSPEAFVNMRKADGLNFPFANREWQSTYWRRKRMVVYRPLDAPAEVLSHNFDMPIISPHYKPYSARLNVRYAALMEYNEILRLTSKDLVTHVVPFVDGEIKLCKLGALADEALLRARSMRAAIVHQKTSWCTGSSGN